jgi:hypothetical protein
VGVDSSAQFGSQIGDSFVFKTINGHISSEDLTISSIRQVDEASQCCVRCLTSKPCFTQIDAQVKKARGEIGQAGCTCKHICHTLEDIRPEKCICIFKKIERIRIKIEESFPADQFRMQQNALLRTTNMSSNENRSKQRPKKPKTNTVS